MQSDRNTIDAAKRFSNRVKEYKNHRPGYPPGVIDFLLAKDALLHGSVVADIGAGTGLLTRLLLPHTKVVYAVEPNDAMRGEMEQELAASEKLRSRKGTAEQTGLADHSIDLVAAAQAFHWFDADKARAEFRRILKPGGFVALIWNLRDVEADDFQRDYESMLRNLIPNYKETHKRSASDEPILRFFASAKIDFFQTSNAQSFDMPSLKGRLLSSSYTPKPPDPAFDLLISHVEKLFNQYQVNGRVRFYYKTNLYLGRLP